MASVQLSPISLRLPESTAGNRNHRSSAAFNAIKRPISVSFAATSPESAPEAPEKPEIELEFVGPKPGADGKYPVESARVVSGEKLLRNIMSDNKIELYAAYGKAMNCGGGGSCGTCIVEILEGRDLLNERTNTELRYLKKVELYRNRNHGGWLAKQLLETKRTPARFWFRGCRSGRSDDDDVNNG